MAARIVSDKLLWPLSLLSIVLATGIVFPSTASAISINSGGIPSNRLVHNRDGSSSQSNPQYSYRWKWCNYNNSSPTSSGYSGFGTNSWGSHVGVSSDVSEIHVDQGEEATQAQINYLGHHCVSNFKDAVTDAPHDNSSLTDTPPGPDYMPVYSAYKLQNRYPIKSVFVNFTNDVDVYVNGSFSADLDVSGINSSTAPIAMPIDNTYADSNNPNSTEYFYLKQSPNGLPFLKTFSINGMNTLEPGEYSIIVRINTRPVTEFPFPPPDYPRPYACTYNGQPAANAQGTAQVIDDEPIPACPVASTDTLFYFVVDAVSEPAGTIACNTINTTRIDANWNYQNIPSGETARLEWRKVGGGSWQVIDSIAASGSRQFNSLEDGSEYVFRLRHYNSSGNPVAVLGNAAYCTTDTEIITGSAPVPASCPSVSNSLFEKTLQNAAPSNAGSKSGDTYTTTSNSAPNQHYDEIVRTGIEVTGTEDVSDKIPGNSGADIDAVTNSSQIEDTYTSAATFQNYGVSPQSKSASRFELPHYELSQSSASANAKVKVDYRAFIEKCPYDRNEAELSYDSHYRQRDWKTKDLPYKKTCNGSDDFKPNTSENECQNVYTASCQSGSWSSGHSHCHSYDSTNPRTYYDPGDNWGDGSCTTDGSGFECTQHNVSNPSSRTVCDAGDTRVGSTCYHYYASTKHYYWEVEEDWHNEKTPRDIDFGVMEPCYKRTYSATTATNSAILSGDNENPTASNFSAHVQVDFSTYVPSNGASDFPKLGNNPLPGFPGSIRNEMRRASEVTIPYVLQFRKNGTGGWTTASASGSTTKISAGSRNRVVNDVNSSTLSATTSINVPQYSPGDRVQWQISAGVNSGTGVNGKTDVDGVSSESSGIHNSQRYTARVENWPYFKVYGNDVASGGGINSCSGTAGMQITFRSGAFGSSVQYAAYVLGDDGGDVGTATLRSGLTGKITTATTASNGTGPIPRGGLMIDNLNSYNQINCMPDYFAWSQDAKPIAKASNTAKTGKNIRQELTTANVNDRNIEYLLLDNADAVMDNGEVVVPDGMRKVIFVDGTLWIDKNIRYSSNSWNNKADVPYVMIVARNIVIGRDVTRLDGMYVAQGDDANSGKIWTCDEYDETENIYDECTKQLVVNGALHATNSVYFMRSFGSLRDGAANEGRSNANPIGSGCGTKSGTNGNPSNAGTFNSSTSCAAEVINFTPEMFLPLTEIVTPEDSFKYDSFSVGAPNL